MNMENNKAEHFSGENEEIDASECNKKINKYIRFPTLTWEKIIKLIIVTGGTGFMIVTFFTGLGYSRHDIDCYDDMPYYYTESIHNYFYEHEGSFNYIYFNSVVIIWYKCSFNFIRVYLFYC